MKYFIYLFLCGFYVKAQLTLQEIDSLSTTTSPTDCKSDEFFCVQDKKCIAGVKQCDFRSDCIDGSDEVGCVKKTCNFQNKDLCGWSVYHKFKNFIRNKRDSDDDDPFRWIPIQANDKNIAFKLDSRPLVDHTTNTTEGWYLLAAPGKTGDNTSLISAKISETHAHCSLDFWMYCAQWTCSLKVYVGDDDMNNMKLLWTADDLVNGVRNTKVWTHAKVLLSSLTNYRVNFEATRPYTFYSSISLDDITFSECPPPLVVDHEMQVCGVGQFMCKNKKCIESNLICDYNNDCTDYSDEKQFLCDVYWARCDFESGICSNWHLEPNGSAHWQTKNGTDPNTPKTDHTTRLSKGMFLTYIPTYAMFQFKSRPKFRSDTIDGIAKNCKLRFWYNFIKQEHRLRIYRRTNYYDALTGIHFLEELSSDIQNYWHRAEIALDSGGDDFQVVLEGVANAESGSINIDDVSLTPECYLAIGRDLPDRPTEQPPVDNCAPEKIACKNGKCYSPLQRCNFIDDCGDNTDEIGCGTSCDFEKNDTCGWYNPGGGRYKSTWVTMRGKDVTSSNGIMIDHTTGTSEGFYITAIASYNYSAMAQLHTRPYVISGENCTLSLWYYLDSIRPDLSVLIQSSKNYDNIHEAWKAGYGQSKSWRQQTIDIGRQEDFRIIIQHVKDGGFKHLAAIDDIEFQMCASEHQPIECLKNEWMCQDKSQCIPIWQLCDGKYDCRDKTDELNCVPQLGGCDFDGENWMRDCNWSSKKLDFEWTRVNASRNDKTGPPRNHNERRKGFFLLADSSKRAPGERAGIATPLFEPCEAKRHLRFWYYMKGSASMGKLEVLYEDEDGQVSHLWEQKGPQESKWLYHHLSVSSSQGYKLAFIATRGGDDLTDIAIDDVSFINEYSRGAIKQLNCTFDNLTLCNWTQPPDTLQWKFGNGSISASPFAKKGHYIFINTYTDSKRGLTAKLQSPIISSPAIAGGCFSFYYRMFGARVGELRVVKVSRRHGASIRRVVFWTRKGTQPDKWLQFQDPLNDMEGDFWLEIEADGGIEFSGNIAIDKLAMSSAACPVQDLCDFESNMCGWKVETSSNEKFYWLRGNNLTMGPSTDHTTLSNSGYYLQAFVENGARPYERTSLVSRDFKGNWGPLCLTFWYYRPGYSTGEITVVVRVGNTYMNIWFATKDAGQVWQYAQVNISDSLWERNIMGMKVMIQAVNGRNDSYRMAIDDVQLKENTFCGDPGRCEFNDDYCGYSQNDTSDFSWQLGTGRVINTQLIDQTPRDRTNAKGMFAYADMTSPILKEGQKAVLLSEILKSEKRTCLIFYYNMFGNDRPQLMIGRMFIPDVEDEESDMKYKILPLLSTASGTQRDWRKLSINIPAAKGERHQIYFTAMRGKGPSGFIAIDDIAITDGFCKDDVTTYGTTYQPPVSVSTYQPPVITDKPDGTKFDFCICFPK